MNVPRTLLDLAGFQPAIAQFNNTTLIIIDAQNEYTLGPIQLPGIATATSRARVLLDAMRKVDGKVIHIVHKGASGGMFDLTSSRGAIIDELKPYDTEIVIEKTMPNAFTRTPLAASLGEPGKTVLVAGFMTHMCVSSTVRAALDLGYPVTVAADACASRDLARIGGGFVSADDVHAAELAALADRFAAVACVSEIVAAQI